MLHRAAVGSIHTSFFCFVTYFLGPRSYVYEHSPDFQVLPTFACTFGFLGSPQGQDPLFSLLLSVAGVPSPSVTSFHLPMKSLVLPAFSISSTPRTSTMIPVRLRPLKLCNTTPFYHTQGPSSIQRRSSTASRTFSCTRPSDPGCACGTVRASPTRRTRRALGQRQRQRRCRRHSAASPSAGSGLF